MNKYHLILIAAIVCTSIGTPGCNESVSKEDANKEETASKVTVAVTNPNFSIAPIEYAELAEKALLLFGKLDFDNWASMLADDVLYFFPDGDVNTRTKLEGKAALLSWWKDWKTTSGIESMTMSEFNHTPVNATAQLKGGAPSGVHVISYFSNKLIYAGKPVDLRMNFVAHFNKDKKIDRYTTYYDRSIVIKTTGTNILAK